MTDANQRAHPDGQDPSTGELVRRAAEQLSLLIRKELALAQAELGRKARHAGIGAGLFGGGAVFGLYGVGALLTAAVLGLAEAVSPWLAGLVVAVVLLGAAGVLALVGRNQVRRALPLTLPETIHSVRADLDEVRRRAQR